VSRFTIDRIVRDRPQETSDGGADGNPKGKKKAGRVRTWWRRWRRVVLGAVAVFLILVGWSLGHALTAPGGGSFSDRLAEWARDHYLGPLVTFGEWVTYEPPKVGGKPSFALTGPAAAVGPANKHLVKSAPAPVPSPDRLRSLAGANLPGEGSWRVLATVHDEPAIYGTFLRASSVYTSYVAGVAWMNQSLVRFELRPGSEDPGPGNWHAQPYILPGSRNGLLATFNSGFKIADSLGGFYLNGASDGRLVPGVASEVYYRNGQLAIGLWDKTVHMTPDVVGVRQNLQLIVSDGHIPSTVDANIEGSWGATLGGGYYVWRSGIGITRGGQIVFAYGAALDVRELAEVLRRAGAVTAMELDINPAWTNYMYYMPHSHPGNPTPVNLLPDQQEPADRYYYINSRDFTAVFAR
jgi:Phosphodiester glycosidase